MFLSIPLYYHDRGVLPTFIPCLLNMTRRIQTIKKARKSCSNFRSGSRGYVPIHHPPTPLLTPTNHPRVQHPENFPGWLLCQFDIISSSSPSNTTQLRLQASQPPPPTEHVSARSCAATCCFVNGTKNKRHPQQYNNHAFLSTTSNFVTDPMITGNTPKNHKEDYSPENHRESSCENRRYPPPLPCPTWRKTETDRQKEGRS